MWEGKYDAECLFNTPITYSDVYHSGTFDYVESAMTIVRGTASLALAPPPSSSVAPPRTALRLQLYTREGEEEACNFTQHKDRLAYCDVAPSVGCIKHIYLHMQDVLRANMRIESVQWHKDESDVHMPTEAELIGPQQDETARISTRLCVGIGYDWIRLLVYLPNNEYRCAIKTFSLPYKINGRLVTSYTLLPSIVPPEHYVTVMRNHRDRLSLPLCHDNQREWLYLCDPFAVHRWGVMCYKHKLEVRECKAQLYVFSGMLISIVTHDPEHMQNREVQYRVIRVSVRNSVVDYVDLQYGDDSRRVLLRNMAEVFVHQHCQTGKWYLSQRICWVPGHMSAFPSMTPASVWYAAPMCELKCNNIEIVHETTNDVHQYDVRQSPEDADDSALRTTLTQQMEAQWSQGEERTEDVMEEEKDAKEEEAEEGMEAEGGDKDEQAEDGREEEETQENTKAEGGETDEQAKKIAEEEEQRKQEDEERTQAEAEANRKQQEEKDAEEQWKLITAAREKEEEETKRQ